METTSFCKKRLARSAGEQSDLGGYYKLLSSKQEPYKVIGVNKNTLRIGQDGLENRLQLVRRR